MLTQPLTAVENDSPEHNREGTSFFFFCTKHLSNNVMYHSKGVVHLLLRCIVKGKKKLGTLTVYFLVCYL